MKILRISRLLTEAKAMGPLYSEEVDSFSHEGEEYDLGAIKKLAREKEAHDLPVDELKWVLDDSGIDPKRFKTVDLENPVIVTRWHDKWLVLDGAHRLSVAVKKKLDTLPTLRVTAAELRSAKLGPSRDAA